MSILNIKFFVFFSIFLLLIPFIPISHQHGLGYELLPPIHVDGKALSLEVSSNPVDNEGKIRQLSFRLLDVKTNEQQQNLIYFIKGYKSNQELFDESFKRNDGKVTLELTPTESGPITFTTSQDAGFFESLLDSEIVKVEGPIFNRGGLYTFDVQVMTQQDFENNNDNALEYPVGISFPDLLYYDIDDPNFGQQQLGLITYYEVIQDFEYEPATRSISFKMPFDWSFDNINQTSVVHEEILIPKTFGDLLVSEYSLHVNDEEIPKEVITIDGFSDIRRIIHIIINQKILFDMSDRQQGENEMRFLVKPSQENIPLQTMTGNGQFKIALNWEPQNLVSNSDVKFSFKVFDVFLKDRPMSANYIVTVMDDDKELFRTTGTSNDVVDLMDSFEFFIPENVSGIINIQLNLDNNELANAVFPVIVNRVDITSDEISIPDWVRNNAGWWSAGQISDAEFASGIEFMIKEKIIKVPVTGAGEKSDDVTIPDWVRNNAQWWSEGQISDKDFANGIQYLVTNGIISV